MSITLLTRLNSAAVAIALGLTLSVQAHAQSVAAAPAAPAPVSSVIPGSIQDLMSQMGPIFKTIGKGITDVSQYPALAGQALILRSLILKCAPQTPDDLATQTAAADLPLARLEFEKMIVTLASQSIDLETALRKGDAPGAQTALAAMAQTKTAGHDKYKQD